MWVKSAVKRIQLQKQSCHFIVNVGSARQKTQAIASGLDAETAGFISDREAQEAIASCIDLS